MSSQTCAAETLSGGLGSNPCRFGLLAVGAWIGQGLLGWWMGARICAPSSVPMVRTVLAGVGVLALAVSVLSLVRSSRTWRVVRRTPEQDAFAFLAFASVFVCGTFSVGILWSTLNAFFITGCGAMR
jgi:hypothetical protein